MQHKTCEERVLSELEDAENKIAFLEEVISKLKAGMAELEKEKESVSKELAEIDCALVTTLEIRPKEDGPNSYLYVSGILYNDSCSYANAQDKIGFGILRKNISRGLEQKGLPPLPDYITGKVVNTSDGEAE